MRIVLTSFGTLGDIHPLIALSLELRRRGHTPVLAVPEIFRPKIASLDLEFAPVGPHPQPRRQPARRHADGYPQGNRAHPARNSLSCDPPELPGTAGRGAGQRRRRPHGCRRARLPGAHRGPRSPAFPGLRTCWAPLSFFSRYDAPVLPPYPMLARLQTPRFLGWEE